LEEHFSWNLRERRTPSNIRTPAQQLGLVLIICNGLVVIWIHLDPFSTTFSHSSPQLSDPETDQPRFDSYDIDRLCREGDPELTEELWGSDMQALYRRNDELIDQLDIEDLRDLEAHYRLVQRHHLKITCKSCCSGLLPGCLIWDLGGNLRLIGNY
jgi:hypothetical protein